MPDADPLDDFRNPPPFPQPNWDLINRLHADRPATPNLRQTPREDVDTIRALFDEHAPQYRMWLVGTLEIVQEAHTAHAMLDMAGFPSPLGYAGDLDARVSTVLQVLLERVNRLDAVIGLHFPEVGNEGFCHECGLVVPCATVLAAKGQTRDPDE